MGLVALYEEEMRDFSLPSRARRKGQVQASVSRWHVRKTGKPGRALPPETALQDSI